ncbi:MAG: multiheme c-type cytochrome, partial [Porticoccaceae bacterium]
MRFLALLLLSALLADHSLAASYTGAASCAGCHEQALEQWQGSHHDWAMKVASPETVLGDFDNASFSHGGV